MFGTVVWLILGDSEWSAWSEWESSIFYENETSSLLEPLGLPVAVCKKLNNTRYRQCDETDISGRGTSCTGALSLLFVKLNPNR